MGIMLRDSDGLFYCPYCNEVYDDYLKYCVVCAKKLEPPPFGDESDYEYTMHRNSKIEEHNTK